MSVSKKNFGASLVEVVIAIAVFSILITSLITLITNVYSTLVQSSRHSFAQIYADEGIEAARSIRRRAWNLLENGTYGLTTASGYWEWNGTQDVLGDYTRTVTIEDICRDVAGDIADCPGSSTDLHAKKITSKVEWAILTGLTVDITLVEYLTNWQSKDWAQIDWSGGSGQDTWSDQTRYFNDDGNIDYSTAGEIKLIGAGSGGCGVKIWDFNSTSQYTFDTAKISVSAGVAQLVSETGGCSGTPATCNTYGDQTSCQGQSGCSWVTGSGSCTQINNCSAIGAKKDCEACNGCIWDNPTKSCGGTLNCSIYNQTSCTPATCVQCNWTGGADICIGTPAACDTFSDQTSCQNQGGCLWSGGGYPTDNPSINPTSSYNAPGIDNWTSFTETATKPAGTQIYYQLSDNDGSTWQYYNGSGWATAGAADYNTANIVNTNITDFPTTTQNIIFKAFLNSDGATQVELDSVEVSCAQYYDWELDLPADYTYDSDKIEVVTDTDPDGIAQLVSQTGMSGSVNWTFDNSSSYNYNPTKIEITSSLVQLITQSSSCTGTPATCNTYGDQTSCQGQSGCSWVTGSGSCTQINNCSAIGAKKDCEACNGCIWDNPTKSCGGTLNCSIYNQTSCTPATCVQCNWTGGADICIGTPAACDTFSDQTSCQNQGGCLWSGGGYPTDNPSINPTSSYNAPGIDNWTSFTETATKPAGTQIYYQLSDNDGSTWQYYNGSGWATAGAADYNTANIVNTNIPDFPTTTQDIMFKAFLNSDGVAQVQLDEIQIDWSSGASYPTDNPSINPTSSYNASGVDSWTSFTETATKPAGTQIYYHLSDNDGASWQYYNGSSWATAGVADYNTADIVNTNISEFSTTTQDIMFKAFLSSDGVSQVKLDTVRVGFGQEVGSGYVMSGWIESSAFDMATASSVNILSWIENSITASEYIQVQIAAAIASTGPWNFIGPDCTNGTYFTSASETLIDKDCNLNDYQWIKYRVELYGNGNVTPILEEIKLNYTP